MIWTAILLLNSYLYFFPLARVIFNFFVAVYQIWYRPVYPLRKRYDRWAIVTGCTDGIGKAYAFTLAKRGFDLLLISRSLTKLKTVEEELKSEFKNIEIRILDIEFTDFNDDKFSQLENILDEIKEIGILINNCGISYEYPDYYNLVSTKTKRDLVEININGILKMIDAVLPKMINKTLKNNKMRKGAIINISSMISDTPFGLFSVYGATKSFVDHLSKSMYFEYKSQGVDFQSHQSGLVATKMSKIRRSSFLVASPRQFAESSANNIGRDSIVIPFWHHRLHGFLTSALPEFLWQKVYFSIFLNVRKKALIRLVNKEK